MKTVPVITCPFTTATTSTVVSNNKLIVKLPFKKCATKRVQLEGSEQAKSSANNKNIRYPATTLNSVNKCESSASNMRRDNPDDITTEVKKEISKEIF